MNDFNKNAKDVKNKASTLYDTAKEKISESYYDTIAKTDDVLDQISDTASDLYQSGQVKLNQAEDYIEECVSRVAHSVKKKPLTSLLIAGGIGYLLGKFSK
jgi:ElaB/YqjD/DUF883 family membrane-anchored ribosome-binding protein